MHSTGATPHLRAALVEVELRGDLALDARYPQDLEFLGIDDAGPFVLLAGVLGELERARKGGAGGVLLVVDSLGGSSWAGLALCEALRGLSEDGVRVLAHVEGCAGSAAAVALLGADAVTVAPAAVVHPHGVCLPGTFVAPGETREAFELLEADAWLNAGLLSTRTLGRAVDVARWLGHPGEELAAERAIAAGYADAVVDLEGARGLLRKLVEEGGTTERRRKLDELAAGDDLEEAELAARDVGAALLSALKGGLVPEIVAQDVLRRWGRTPGAGRLQSAASATRHLRFGSSIVMLFGKIPTGVKQALGLFTSSKEIRRKHMVSGLRRFVAEGWKDYLAESGEGRHMDKQLDRDARELFTSLQAKFGDADRAKARIIEWGAMPIMLVQKSVNAVTWYAAREQALAEGHADPVAYADSLVRMTQTGGGIKDLAAIQRGGEAFKMLTVMFSYRSVLYNLLAEKTPGKSGWRKASEIAARAFWLVLMPVVAEQLLMAGIKDDEDAEDVARRLSLEMALLPLSTIPVLGDAAEMGLEGRPMGTAPWIETLGRVGAAGRDVLQGDADELDAKAVAEFVGVVTHTPTAALWNYGDYVNRLLTGQLEEPLQDLFLRSPGQWE